MLNYQEITIAFKLIELIRQDELTFNATHRFGDWLEHLQAHLDYSLEE